MTKSSIDSVNAMSAPAMTPGMISGSVTGETWTRVCAADRVPPRSSVVHARKTRAHDDRDKADAEVNVRDVTVSR